MPRSSLVRITMAAAAGGAVLFGFAAAAGAFVDPTAPQTSAAVAPPTSGEAASNSLNASGIGPGALPGTQDLAKLGIINPIEIEREHGRIEIRHRDAQGRLVETYLDAGTGAVLKQEIEFSPQRFATQSVATTAPAPGVDAASNSLSGSGALPRSEDLAKLGIVNPIEIEREHGRIEIRHRDAQGRLIETYLDAETGAVVKQEIEFVSGKSGKDRDDD